MGDILIKGMEMPCEEAEPLRIELYADGTVIVIREQDDFYEFKAVPVPPHGRCIDADAILMRINHEIMEAYMDGACYGVHPSSEHLYLLGEIIDDAPTVIPASEEET